MINKGDISKYHLMVAKCQSEQPILSPIWELYLVTPSSWTGTLHKRPTISFHVICVHTSHVICVHTSVFQWCHKHWNYLRKAQQWNECFTFQDNWLGLEWRPLLKIKKEQWKGCVTPGEQTPQNISKCHYGGGRLTKLRMNNFTILVIVD